MATDVEAAQLIYAVARAIDKGDKDVSGPSAMCKLLLRMSRCGLQLMQSSVFGGYGYMKEYPVEK